MPARLRNLVMKASRSSRSGDLCDSCIMAATRSVLAGLRKHCVAACYTSSGDCLQLQRARAPANSTLDGPGSVSRSHWPPIPVSSRLHVAGWLLPSSTQLCSDLSDSLASSTPSANPPAHHAEACM
ncbi:uncharacterized protein MYCFIDRAFT_80421 [Pseudocercospora fijiensis CIRAD86]|uniref:Uncharacterized protein n=1 Tax=Pseudocercospora fijiensis (strain CIRAD86) TaxID=383855 RepID=M3B073_PSEFD|nr:uncharacterized protein MYCFIDRAFT_80421 [Pseudocercospora fijiensis CIRAD86]EME82822.1 hypothetical protein MYCFIDRAFT_80421 [Pseudocercospora fijiensis CIRAD86]